MARRIPLSRGDYAIVDDANFDWLSQWNWHSDGRYAKRKTRDHEANPRTSLYMHRAIVGVEHNQEVDHINGDKFDNRRANLRVASRTDNTRNIRKYETANSGPNASQYKGVCYIPRLDSWVAYIVVNRRNRYFGYWKTEESAARARDLAAREWFGEFAHLNFPEEYGD